MPRLILRNTLHIQRQVLITFFIEGLQRCLVALVWCIMHFWGLFRCGLPVRPAVMFAVNSPTSLSLEQPHLPCLSTSLLPLLLSCPTSSATGYRQYLLSLYSLLSQFKINTSCNILWHYSFLLSFIFHSHVLVYPYQLLYVRTYVPVCVCWSSHSLLSLLTMVQATF